MPDVMAVLEIAFGIIAEIAINAILFYMVFKIFQCVFIATRYRAARNEPDTEETYYHNLYLESDRWMRTRHGRRTRK